MEFSRPNPKGPLLSTLDSSSGTSKPSKNRYSRLSAPVLEKLFVSDIHFLNSENAAGLLTKRFTFCWKSSFSLPGFAALPVDEEGDVGAG
jgi:tagatose-1,6-bisphosphate aldolase